MNELDCEAPGLLAPFLFSPETMERLTEAEKQGEYTLERLQKLRPEVIQEIIKLRGEFVGMLRIAKMVGVHHKTVAGVDAAFPEDIEKARARRVSRLRTTADVLVEQIFDNPGCVPGHAKALAASQLYDKAELLDGRATVRVEEVKRIDIYGDWDEIVEKQLQPANSIDIESVKVVETGSDAGKSLAIKNGAGGQESIANVR